MKNFKFKNGSELTDKISRLHGVCTGRVEYITGCRQYLIQPEGDGKTMSESHWIDESRLYHDVTTEAPIFIDTTEDIGFDKQAPKI